jgi:hypothetical protein
MSGVSLVFIEFNPKQMQSACRWLRCDVRALLLCILVLARELK